MSYPFSENNIFPWNPETNHWRGIPNFQFLPQSGIPLRGTISDNSFDLSSKLGANPLIGVKTQDPFSRRLGKSIVFINI